MPGEYVLRGGVAGELKVAHVVAEKEGLPFRFRVEFDKFELRAKGFVNGGRLSVVWRLCAQSDGMVVLHP